MIAPSCRHDQDVEADEVWGFIGCKEKTRQRLGHGQEFGDCYTFVAIERTSKLILAWHSGRRTANDTGTFALRLRAATDGRFQLTTDGFQPYETIMPDVFTGQVDFAQLIKVYGKQPDAPKTPAMAAGLTNHVWTLAELLNELATHC